MPRLAFLPLEWVASFGSLESPKVSAKSIRMLLVLLLPRLEIKPRATLATSHISQGGL